MLAQRKNRLRAAWALSAGAAILAILATIGIGRLVRDPEVTARSSLLPPKDMRFEATMSVAVLSPDGERVAFVAVGEDGKSSLGVRPLADLAARPLAGTEGAEHPFWSPDS